MTKVVGKLTSFPGAEFMNSDSVLFNTDSYKVSHFAQDPRDVGNIHIYGEARGGPFKEATFFGLQYLLMKYLTTPITKEEVEQAQPFYMRHMGVFDIDGWNHILNAHGGYMPISISAVPEGLSVGVKNAIISVTSTDPKVRWAARWVEAMVLRGIWYPTSVCTLSRRIKTILKNFWEISSTEPIETLDFKLHDFGARGSTSKESSGIAGAAHLVNFKGTDTISGLLLANNYYGEKMAGYSIPAAEHSTITVWGKDKEVEAYRNMIATFGDHHHFAVVSDSYDLWNAISNIWGVILKDDVLKAKGVLVIRPDSGDPVEVVRKSLRLLADKFGVTENSKGYKVLNKVRIIQGDGVNMTSISDILMSMMNDGYSIDNIAFGMGGKLHQEVDRDTMKWAMKASAIQNEKGDWVDVYKDPITDPGKSSKKGVLGLFYEKGQYVTHRLNNGINFRSDPNFLTPVFKNGDILKVQSFQGIRDLAAIK